MQEKILYSCEGIEIRKCQDKSTCLFWFCFLFFPEALSSSPKGKIVANVLFQ